VGVAVNAVKLGETSGDFSVNLNSVDALLLDDTLDELTVGNSGATVSRYTGFGDVVLHGPDEVRINIDSDNDATTDLFVVGNDADSTSSDALFVVSENGSSWFLDSAGTTQTMIFNLGLGVNTTDTDIEFLGTGVIGAESNMVLAIDTDANETTRFLEIRNNSNASGAGTRMAVFLESPNGDGVSFSLGEVAPDTTDVFQACQSGDCTALFQIRNEGETTLLSEQFNDSGAVNGFFMENENAVADTSLDMFDIRSADTNATGMDMMEFQDGAAVIGRITVDSTSSVAYNTTSDARRKENERPITNPLTTLLGVEVHEFEWKEDSSVDHGMYAQELKLVYPLAVSGDENGDPHEDPMSIHYAKMVPLMIAAMQELHVKVEMLEDELTTLKGSALSPKIERGAVVQVNDYTAPSYAVQPASAITCTDLRDCRAKYEVNRSGCNPTFALHRLESAGTYSLECRKVTGYSQKNTQRWVRR